MINKLSNLDNSLTTQRIVLAMCVNSVNDAKCCRIYVS